MLRGNHVGLRVPLVLWMYDAHLIEVSALPLDSPQDADPTGTSIRTRVMPADILGCRGVGITTGPFQLTIVGIVSTWDSGILVPC
jgi:hypothetical protein